MLGLQVSAHRLFINATLWRHSRDATPTIVSRCASKSWNKACMVGSDDTKRDSEFCIVILAALWLRNCSHVPLLASLHLSTVMVGDSSARSRPNLAKCSYRGQLCREIGRIPHRSERYSENLALYTGRADVRGESGVIGLRPPNHGRAKLGSYTLD